jgi:DNA replication protein DnaC
VGISDPVPPVGEMTPWQTTALYRLTDARYRAGRATWVTINATSLDDINARLTTPIFDRLRHDAELIHCNWPSYRKGPKAGG